MILSPEFKKYYGTSILQDQWGWNNILMGQL